MTFDRAEEQPYSVQEESRRLLDDGILQNCLNAAFPDNLKNFAKFISFTGSPKPSIPINWRIAESLSALKGLEACFINLLLARKYEQKPVEIQINT